MTLNESERRMELRLVLGQNPGDRPYLVEVWARCWWLGRLGARGIFEVDLEKGTQEEVESLGNACLFLNDSSSFCMEFNAGSCLPGIKPNHVYFTDYVDEKNNWKSYSMGNRKVETCFDPTSRPYASQWFQPDF
ncbi:uncharacterized protein LOC130137834 [Syzygium oleosum]|uniref:uncharacterized protein LOC130137834 n=1 Tax=Syzygium oleosum TaxID=219896 RepID=UPI0024BAE7DA|nr:uncharacterized protein LOC130137834 [Syzygium oleosum]